MSNFRGIFNGMPFPPPFIQPDGGGQSTEGESGDRGTGGRRKEDMERRMKRSLFTFKLFLAAAFLGIAALNSFYTLSENEMAVITTFGIPSSVMTSGPKFKYPFIQNVHKMSKEIKGMAIGYNPDYTSDSSLGLNMDTSSGYEYTSGSEDPASIPSESEMITKDFNFVNVDFYIEYQIIDPVKAYINRDTAITILKNLAQSYIRDTVGSYSVDEVITTGKAEIQARVKSLLSERLEQEDIGIGINNVTIQDAEPPTAAVNDAFKAVEDAKQGMDTKINQAKKYQSEQLPAANAKADKAKKDAEAYRQQRISEAEGQVSRFNDMYAEYAKYPLITKKRMFYETMEELLPGLKVIINGSDGTQTMLPLDSFVSAPIGNGTSSGYGSQISSPQNHTAAEDSADTAQTGSEEMGGQS